MALLCLEPVAGVEWTGKRRGVWKVVRSLGGGAGGLAAASPLGRGRHWVFLAGSWEKMSGLGAKLCVWLEEKGSRPCGGVCGDW